jgi:uncharacterized protein YgiM (DUF1202 family)
MGERAAPVRRGAGSFARLLIVTALIGGLALAIGRPQRAAAADFAIGASVAVTSETLTYRNAPSATAPALLLFTQGTVGTITAGPVVADGYTWYEFSTNEWDGLPGWVAGEFLTPAGEAPLTGTLVVALDGLNLRSAPGLSGPIIAALPAGMRVNLVGGPAEVDGYEWYEVASLDDLMQGWVAGSYLTAAPAGIAFAPGDMVVVTIADLNYRERPGLDGPVRTTLALGTTGQIIGGPINADGQIWYQIALTTADGNGWVSATYLARP